MQAQKSISKGQKGYVLLAIMLFMTLMAIGLALQAPRIKQEIRREKEEELIHRGNEYKSAIRKYFRKFGAYPVSVDQLESTNNLRFLRKRYKDPFTGKDDWHLLHQGEVQLNPATGGLNTPGQPSGQIGSAIGGSSIGGSSLGGNSGFGSTIGGSSGSTGFGQSSGFGSTSSSNQSPTDPNAAGGAQNPNNGGITPVGNLAGASNSPVIGGGPIIGVSSTSKEKSIKVRDGKDHYNDWAFFYDPRFELPTGGGLGVPGAQGLNPAGGIGNGQGTPGGSSGINPTPGPGTIGSPGTGGGTGPGTGH